jgi:hypothetical protein
MWVKISIEVETAKEMYSLFQSKTCPNGPSQHYFHFVCSRAVYGWQAQPFGLFQAQGHFISAMFRPLTNLNCTSHFNMC